MLFLFALFNILTLICCKKKDVFLYEECDNESCNWYKNSRFVGCIDKHVLCFSYFDTTSSIDLTSVRQIFIQSEFDCNDVPSIIEYAKNVPIVFVGDDETQCVSWTFHYESWLSYYITSSQPLHDLYELFVQI